MTVHYRLLKDSLKTFLANEYSNAPAAIDFWTEQEHKESFEYNVEVFGDLHSVFFELAKVLMTIDMIIRLRKSSQYRGSFQR